MAKNFLKVMRITGILCLVCVMHLSAAVHSQTARINLKMKDATIEQVLNKISESTQLDFFYSNSKIDVSKRVNVDFLDATIEQALQLIFKGYDVKFEINDNFVVIHYVRALAVTDSLKKITVRGTVKDVDEMTLPGVTIQVKGTTIGFTTNEEGKFDFDLPKRDTLVLIFSFVGYQKQEVRLKRDNKPLNIVMKNDMAEIDEVVVTGIFNKPKESFTGAVTHITKEDIMAYGNRNLLQTLNNIDPAFVIRENNTYGSNPNVLPEIQIRGISRIAGYYKLTDVCSGRVEPTIIRVGWFRGDVGTGDGLESIGRGVCNDFERCEFHGSLRIAGCEWRSRDYFFKTSSRKVTSLFLRWDKFGDSRFV